MRKSYWLRCTCGKRFRVDSTQAGELIRCECGKELAVPTLHEMEQLEPLGNAGDPTKRRASPVWGKRQSRITLGAIIAATALLLLGYHELTRPRLPPVESLAPIQVWTIWQDLRRGPDRHLGPVEKQLVDRLHKFHAWRIVLITIAAAGGLLMAYYFATPERTRLPAGKAARSSARPP